MIELIYKCASVGLSVQNSLQCTDVLHISSDLPGLPHPEDARSWFLQSKGKAIPLQAWTGPESSNMLRLPDFKTIGT
jgi:hypothetical protein